MATGVERRRSARRPRRGTGCPCAVACGGTRRAPACDPGEGEGTGTAGPADRQAVETAASAVRDALNGEDAAAIRDRAEALQQAVMALAQSAAAAGAAAPEPAEDGVVDAEFTEVPDDERK